MRPDIKYIFFKALPLAAFFLSAFLLLSAARPVRSPRPASAAPALPRRIVCFSPAAAEVFFALSAGERLAGVSDYCVYPEAVKKIPRVGGFYNPNFERLLALSPDLVIVQGQHEKVADFCRSRKIPLIHVQMDSLAGIRDGIFEIGRITGKAAPAKALWGGIQRDLDAVRAAVAGLPRTRVFLCVGRSPDGLNSINTAGGKSFVSELLTLAGGENIFADLTLPYPEAGKESLLTRAPEVILELRPGENLSASRRARIIADWDEMGALPAVRNHRVLILTDEFLMLPGPRVGQAARVLARTLHPEVKLP